MTNMRIPFVNLGKQFVNLETELMKAFVDIGRSGQYILGDRLESFEQKMATFCEVDHAIGVANGSDALFLVLKHLGLDLEMRGLNG